MKISNDLRNTARATTNPFKRGDYVVCTNSLDGYNKVLATGETYRVADVRGPFVDIDSGTDDNITAYHSRFKAASDDTVESESHPSGFKVGDKVRCVVGCNYHLKKGDIYTVTKLRYGTRDIYVDNQEISWLHNRFEKAVPDDVTGSAAEKGELDEFVLSYARQLDEAVANGTYVPHLTSLGLLSSFLIDYRDLEHN